MQYKINEQLKKEEKKVAELLKKILKRNRTKKAKMIKRY